MSEFKMAILSDEDQKPAAAMAIPSDENQKPAAAAKTFNVVLDQSNPLAFIESALEFVARETDLFKSYSVIKDVNALVRTVKEKLDAQERKKNDRLVPAPAPVTSSTVKEAKIDQEDQAMTYACDEAAALLVPNKGNGLNLDKYSWGQSLQDVTINIPVPPGTKSASIACEINKNHLKVGLKDQPPIIDGELFNSVKVDDSFWSLEDQKSISLLLTKQQQEMKWWKSLVKGGPMIDTKKVEPQRISNLSDLDLETQSSVEKRMYDQRQKQMHRRELIKVFLADNPKMDISRAKFM